MSNKFVKNLTLSDNGIRDKRASILGSQAKTAQEKLILELKSDKNNLEAQISNLEDLSPDSSISLRPGGENFDANSWVTKYQSAQVALANKKVELQIAEKTFEEWFAEAKEEAAQK